MRWIKRFFSNFDDTMAAIAFAEEGELEMARQIMAESEMQTEKSKKVELSTYLSESRNKGMIGGRKVNMR
ncbi:MAG: hypothetical protein QME63_00680 [Actinomycetota bacterium]|nr:hypothetical protein [Actinomycetota bacterium]